MTSLATQMLLSGVLGCSFVIVKNSPHWGVFREILIAMSDELKKTLPRIRTFATDFEHDREESGLPLPADITVPKAGVPKPSAPASLSEEVFASSDEEEVPTISINAHVPAFHELKKRSSSDTTATSRTFVPVPTAAITPIKETNIKTVVVRNQKQPARKSVSIGGGTIITDNKRSKQRLIPALIASIRNWFKALSASSKQKHAPKYTVIDTKRRKGVIQRATTKTGTIFTADNETLKEDILRRSWENPSQRADEPDITWSPNTEVGYPLLDSGLPKPSNVTVEFKKRTEPAAVVPAPMPIVVVPAPVFVEPTVPEPVVAPQPPIEPVLVRQPVIAPVEEAAPEAPTPIEVEIKPEYELTTPEAHYRIRSIGDVTKLNTNILSISVVATVAGVIIAIIIGRALFGVIFGGDPQAAIIPATPIGSSAIVTDIVLDTPTQEALIIALQQIPMGEAVEQEFRITDASGTPLQKQELLVLLGFSNTGSLSQTITEARILHNRNTRSIILTVSDATTAFGSLLSWEGYMVDSLGPILNISRPAKQLTVTDRTIQNTDLRIFTADNQEVLVYGFIDANTVLITKDVPSFTAALDSQ